MMNAPNAPKTPSERLKKHPPKSEKAGRPKNEPTIIEEQENEDLEVDEGLEDGNPEKPGNVPRF
jgi:hypothetical protein